MIPGTPISVGGGASFIATRGIDVGVEFYTFGRNYLSAAVGWMRTSWTAADFNSQNQMITKNVSYDSFLLKIGLGF